MKNVQHICQRAGRIRHALGSRLGVTQTRFLPQIPEQAFTLSPINWKTGRKMTIKVLVSDAAQ